MSTCDSCQAELTYPSAPDQPYTHYCQTCKTCNVCGELISLEDLEACLDAGTHPFTHASHLSTNSEANANSETTLHRLESGTLPTPSDLDKLNAQLLAFTNLIVPNLDVSIPTNTQTTEIHAITWFTSLTSIDEKFIALRKIETLAATCALLLKKDPSAKNVKIKLDIDSSERFKDAVASESKQDAKRIRCTKCHDKFLEADIAKHYATCKGAPPKTKAKVERMVRTKFEAAVDTMTKYGMTVEEATNAAKASFEAQGLPITFTAQETSSVIEGNKP